MLTRYLFTLLLLFTLFRIAATHFAYDDDPDYSEDEAHYPPPTKRHPTAIHYPYPLPQPPVPPSSSITKRSSSPTLNSLACLEAPPPKDPMYFWDLFLEDTKSFVCVDHGQRKTYYHGHDRLVFVNGCGQRRCFQKKTLAGKVQVLWEMAVQTCEGAGAMGRETGNEKMEFWLFGGARGL